jgi:hypothetical protein
MFKDFLMKKMLQSKLKSLPKDQQDKIMKAFTENPKLFETLAAEIQQKMKGGKSQQAAAMEVIMAHKNELKGLL